MYDPGENAVLMQLYVKLCTTARHSKKKKKANNKAEHEHWATGGRFLRCGAFFYQEKYFPGFLLRSYREKKKTAMQERA